MCTARRPEYVGDCIKALPELVTGTIVIQSHASVNAGLRFKPM